MSKARRKTKEERHARPVVPSGELAAAQWYLGVIQSLVMESLANSKWAAAQKALDQCVSRLNKEFSTEKLQKGGKKSMLASESCGGDEDCPVGWKCCEGGYCRPRCIS